MIRLMSYLLDRACSVIGAIIFLQAPLFMQAYQQQLAGHVEELHYQVARMRQAANQTHKTLEQYVNKFVNSGDVDFAEQGKLMSGLIFRWEGLGKDLQALEKASPFTKPFHFVTQWDYRIGSAALRSFQPGLPLTYEGLIYACVGLLFGYGVYMAFRKIFCGLKGFVRRSSERSHAKIK